MGYEYYGSQSLGNYVQWPGMQDCGAYDPRYRPWYAVGASGPKDVLVVIDTSGSMVGTRISLAREAARYVLDTLTDGDYGGVVTFSFCSVAMPPPQAQHAAVAEMPVNGTKSVSFPQEDCQPMPGAP